MIESIEPTAFQRRVCLIPEEYDLALLGGRGGGKSWGILFLVIRHIETYGHLAKVFYLRRTYAGLGDFIQSCLQLFGMLYPNGFRWNAQEHIFRFPNGAIFELGQFEGLADFNKYQGRSGTLLIVDEAGQYATPEALDLLRSNLRGPRDMPLRFVLAANPGGPGHHFIAKRYVFKAAPWVPFLEETSKRMFVHAPSTYVDNNKIDQEQYLNQLQSACSTDAELLRAWVTGDWAVARGAYFADVLDEKRNAIDPLKEIPRNPHSGERWQTWLAHDYGSTAPSVTFLLARSPGAWLSDRYIPRDSIVVVDELAAYRRDDTSRGLGWTAAVTAERILEFCERWGVRPAGVADDACFAKAGHETSIADEFARGGVHFQPAKKAKRIPGWQVLKRLMADAGKADCPGLYISRTCSYFWQTVPYLPRDQKAIEDVDSSASDHAADALRYGVARQEWITELKLGYAM